MVLSHQSTSFFLSIAIRIAFFVCSGSLFGQGTDIPIGHDAYRILDRMEIKSGSNDQFNSSLKGIPRGAAMQFLLQADTSTLLGNRRNRQDHYFLCCENNDWLAIEAPLQTSFGRQSGYFEQIPDDTLYRFIPTNTHKKSEQSPYYYRSKPIWDFFYPTPANWIQLDKESFSLRISPMFHGKLFRSNGGNQYLYTSVKGVEVRGSVDNRIYFYSQLTDNRARYADYVDAYIQENKALPGNGLYKNFQSTTFDWFNGYDYLNGQGYVGLTITKSLDMQFGHGRHFIGNGYRSMLLSNFSHNYLYLKLNWRFWRFHYQNLFSELAANTANAISGDNLVPKKYMAGHYLGFDISNNMSIGLYEAVIFQRENGFELQYLNPAIMYRTVEHLLGSQDNVLLGLDYKWNIFRKARVYAQFILDEYKASFPIFQ